MIKFAAAFTFAAFLGVQDVQAVEVTKEYINKNRSYQNLKAIGVVIHDTDAPGGTAQNNRDYFNNNSVDASAHYFVDWNKVIQTIPENEVAWHAGRTANHKYLSIEICVPSKHNAYQFNKAYNNAVDLTVDMCRRYNWKVSDIFSHEWCSLNYKETDHTDPVAYFREYGKSMDTFRKDVARKLSVADNNGISDSEVSKAASYLGDNARKVQYLLNCFGYNLYIDGQCGRRTTQCIGYLQTRLDIYPDHLFGPKSIKKALSQLDIAERGCGFINETKLIQYMLGVTPQDGIFGNKTYAKVVEFQKNHGIYPDGRVGFKTFTKLFEQNNAVVAPNPGTNNKPDKPAKPSQPTIPTRTNPMDNNARKAANYLGNKITKVQYLLNCFGYNLNVDGNCGKHTAQCIGDLQKRLGLNSDYLFGTKSFSRAINKLDIAEKGCRYTNETRLIQYILGVTPRDGIFGNKTYAKVVQFQKSHGIWPDGRVGVKTFNKMLI